MDTGLVQCNISNDASTHTQRINTILLATTFLGIRSTLCSWMQWPLEAIDPYFHASSEQEEKVVSMSSSAEKDSEYNINTDNQLAAMLESYTLSLANP